ncbi:MAG: hypothetical protein IPM07_22380 [Anaerolineales bacterium]|nr:hypothetical protein [Anaerolineales bacterium]
MAARFTQTGSNSEQRSDDVSSTVTSQTTETVRVEPTASVTTTLVPLMPNNTPTISVPTATPVSIDFNHPNVQIELVTGSPGVDIKIFAGGEVIPDIEVEVKPAVQDAIGQWRTDNRNIPSLESNSSTGIVSTNLEPGTYGITYLTQVAT